MKAAWDDGVLLPILMTKVKLGMVTIMLYSAIVRCNGAYHID
jgi:hypothetical protein